MTRKRENARQAGGPGRTSNAVKSAHSQAENVAQPGVFRIATCGLPLLPPDGGKGRLLAALMRHPEGIRPFDLNLESWPAGVAVCVQRLRNDGWDIETKKYSSGYKHVRTGYAQYRLEPVEMGEPEQHFLMACQFVEMGVW